VCGDVWLVPEYAYNIWDVWPFKQNAISTEITLEEYTQLCDIYRYIITVALRRDVSDGLRRDDFRWKDVVEICNGSDC